MNGSRLAGFIALACVAACDDAVHAGGSGGSGGRASTGAAGAPSPDAAGGSSPISDAGGAGGSAPIEPTPEADCHPREVGSARGAYFRKVKSEPSSDARAIHAIGTLPIVELDPDRWFSTPDPALQYQNGPLDRPSVYLGGRSAGVEVDAGFTWDRVYEANGAATWTDLLASASDGGDPAHRFVIQANGDVTTVNGDLRPEGLEGLVENFAFRPFWRADGGWHNPAVGSDDNQYWYPGEGFRMLVAVWGAEDLVLVINHGIEGESDGLEVSFSASGWAPGVPASFKRVSSIDQFTVIDGQRIGLESAGIDVLATETTALAMRWHAVRVLGAGSVELSKLDCSAPVVTGADAVFQSDYDAIFLIYDQSADGGERTDVIPSRVRGSVRQ